MCFVSGTQSSYIRTILIPDRTNGVEFKIGTGFNDDQRRKPPKIGSIVTFKYQELSNDGNPRYVVVLLYIAVGINSACGRFPAYLRERTDVTWADVLEAAKTKPPFSTKKKVVPALKKQHTIMFSTVPSLDPVSTSPLESMM